MPLSKVDIPLKNEISFFFAKKKKGIAKNTNTRYNSDQEKFGEGGEKR